MEYLTSEEIAQKMGYINAACNHVMQRWENKWSNSKEWCLADT